MPDEPTMRAATVDMAALYDDDRPPPPTIIRDQTTPLYSAEELTEEVGALEVRRGGRLDSGEVYAIVGRAAGALEGLQAQADRVPALLRDLEHLRAQLDALSTEENERALRLWRASKMTEVQKAVEEMWADAVKHAEQTVGSARKAADGLLAEAKRRAKLAESQGIPARPARLDDRIEDALARVRYHAAVRAWLADQEESVAADLASVRSDLDEAVELMKPNAVSAE